MPHLPVQIHDAGASTVVEAPAAAARPTPVPAVSTTVTSSRAAALVEVVCAARLLVVGRESRGVLDRVVSGSTTAPAAARAWVPATAVPGDRIPPATSGRVIAGLNARPNAAGLLGAAFERAPEPRATPERAWKLPDSYGCRHDPHATALLAVLELERSRALLC